MYMLVLRAGLGIGVALAITTGTASAQHMGGPTETKGMAEKVLSAYDLGTQGLDDWAKRRFRMREIVLEPNGVVAAHSHKERPGLTYVQKGTLVEFRNGTQFREYKAGEVITESTDVTHHWVENKSGEPVTLIAVDLVKP